MTAQIIPLPVVHVCSRCEAISDPFDTEDEAREELDWAGWEMGGAQFVDLCPRCIAILNGDPEVLAELRGWV